MLYGKNITEGENNQININILSVKGLISIHFKKKKDNSVFFHF